MAGKHDATSKKPTPGWKLPAPQCPCRLITPPAKLRTDRSYHAFTEADRSDGCLACKQRKVEYECVPCGCHAFCRGCAMKVATGGR